VSQFAVAAVSDRRNLLNQKPAVGDRRYSKPDRDTTPDPDHGLISLQFNLLSEFARAAPPQAAADWGPETSKFIPEGF
jgi:hypothetical protein